MIQDALTVRPFINSIFKDSSQIRSPSQVLRGGHFFSGGTHSQWVLSPSAPSHLSPSFTSCHSCTCHSIAATQNGWPLDDSGTCWACFCTCLGLRTHRQSCGLHSHFFRSLFPYHLHSGTFPCSVCFNNAAPLPSPHVPSPASRLQLSTAALSSLGLGPCLPAS